MFYVKMSRQTSIFLAIALLVAIAPAIAFANPAEFAAGELLVNVTTDLAVYQSGDVVGVTVTTTVDGELAEAKITKAMLTITLPNGKTVQNDISKDFVMVSPGVFTASGKVKAPGPRTLEITAKAVKKVGCKCKKIWLTNQGFIGYTVEADPLEAAISVDNASPSMCDTIEVSVHVNRRANIQVVAIYPNGTQKNLVIPGWVNPGEVRISVDFDNLDIGAVILKVSATDYYGQFDMASVAIDVGFGVCDCPEGHH